MAGTPQVLPMLGGGPQVIGIKLVEPSAAQVQLLSGGRGRQFIAPKSSKDFTDQGCAQTVRELAIVFFIVAKMREWQPNNESAIPALRAFRRPPLRSGLLQARGAGRVRLCSHTCPGLNAHCSPLLATQHPPGQLALSSLSYHFTIPLPFRIGNTYGTAQNRVEHPQFACGKIWLGWLARGRGNGWRRPIESIWPPPFGAWGFSGALVCQRPMIK